MVQRNKFMSRLESGYLFPELNRRKKEFLAKNPNAKLINLGIGNTTEPITPYITNALKNAALALGTPQGYLGYGDEQGFLELRQKLAEKVYQGIISAEEVFISDGAKCDIGRMQLMFGSNVKIALQDPSYPVYVDGSVLIGASGRKLNSGQFADIVYMNCSPKNNFFPDLNKLPKVDLIYLCSPNNPTGAAATKTQLSSLVEFALKARSIIIYDSAYSEYIQDEDLPKSIYEIEHAKEVAIEVSSFSKSIGFTGVRLGWSIVPKELKFNDGTPVRNDWNRIMTTIFNGASNIAQFGGLASLDSEGLKEMSSTVLYYLENAKLIKEALQHIGIESYGGINVPYVWANFNRNSWIVFNEILEKAHIITTPGSGFGPAGEGFIRFSAFSHRQDVQEAAKRLKEKLHQINRGC